MIRESLRELWIRANLHRKRGSLERDLEAELAHHLEQRALKNAAAGMDAAEARYAARRQFGNVTSLKEQTREVWGGNWLAALRQDLRYAARLMRKSPGFTAIAILTLAGGVGASSAVFSLINSILIKPLPYPESDRIILPSLVSPPGINLGSEYFPWGQKQFRLLTRDAHPFQAIGAFQSDSFNLTGIGEPFFLDGYRVSAGFFPALGISPTLGRTFTNEEDQPGREYEVVVSDRLWRQQFFADRNILGRAIQLSGHAYTVIGVMPSDFDFPRSEEMPSSFNFPRQAELWVPLAIAREPKGGPSELAVIGRLRSGISLEQAQSALNLVTRHAEAQDAQWKGWFNIRVVPLMRQITGDTRRPLQLLFGAVALVLLISCSNVGNLLLSRAMARHREFALRSALGAARGRMVRQLLTESIAIALAAGVLGLLLAYIAIDLAKAFAPPTIPRLHEVTLDWPVFAFTLTVSLLAGILFGMAPALTASQENLSPSLNEGTLRSGTGPATPRLRNALLVSQIALALVLVIAAGLLTRTFFRIVGAESGFNPERVLTFQLSLPELKYPDQSRIVPLFRDVLERLRAIPGVESAGVGETVPMGGEGESTVIRFDNHPVFDPKALPFANYTIVSPGYFSAVGTPLLRGRDFSSSDSSNSSPVAIVNAAMERKYWPATSALGQQVGPAGLRYPLLTIVGVVPDLKHISLREQSVPEMFVLYNQNPWPSMLNMRIALRTKNSPTSAIAAVQQAIHSLDPDLPLAKVAALTTLVDDSLSQSRFSLSLLVSFGFFALLLASIGMYGVISYSVLQRTREIGIRVALGANQRHVLSMVLTHGARLAAVGISIGTVAALAATRLMAGLLYQVTPTDPLTFLLVSLLLVFVAFLACLFPALRATRLDPVTALHID
jgi:putative ABC transport system permease protein